MTPPTADLTRTLLATLIISLLIAGSLWVIRPFLPALIWATMIVVATWPVMLYFQREFGGRRWAAVLVMELILTMIVFLPFAMAVVTIVENVDVFARWAAALPTLSLPSVPGWLTKIPLAGSKLATEWKNLAEGGPGGLAARLQPYANEIINWILAQVGSMGLVFVHLVLTLVVSGVLYANGEAGARNVLRFARRVAGDHGDRSVRLAAQAIRAVALGIVVTALVQSALGGLGVLVAGVPYAGLLTAIMLVFCIAQLGPTLPMLGVVAWLFWKEQTAWAVGLLVWGVFVAMLDNFLRPLLIKRGADLSLLLILVGVLGGLLGFGVVGLFVGPVILAVTSTLLETWIAQEGQAEPEIKSRI